jgi:hypothetical protein
MTTPFTSNLLENSPSLHNFLKPLIGMLCKVFALAEFCSLFSWFFLCYCFLTCIIGKVQIWKLFQRMRIRDHLLSFWVVCDLHWQLEGEADPWVCQTSFFEAWVLLHTECWWSQSCIYETSSFTLSELWLDALKCKAWIFEISQSSHDGQLFSYLIVQWHADQNPQTEHCCSVGHSNLWGCCCANLPRASRWLGEVFSHEGSMA